MADTSALDPAATDLVKILQLSLIQPGNNTLHSSIDFIIGELSHCLSLNYVNQSDLQYADNKCKLERLRLMLNVKTNACKDDGAEGSGFEETIVKNCLSTLDQICKQDNCLITLICDILGLCLKILELNKPKLSEEVLLNSMQECTRKLVFVTESSYLVEETSQSIISSDLVQPIVNLKIIETILDVLLVDKLQSSHHYGLLSLFDSETFINLIVCLASQSNQLLMAQTLLCIIPKLVEFSSNNILLVKLWMHMLKWKTVELKHSQVFLILSTLADYYIPDSSKVNFNLAHDSVFLKLLQFGLVHDDSLIRKQALYLLKRTIDQASANCSSIRTDEDILVWDPNKAKTLDRCWESLFTALETLEEKQIHLITPVLVMVDTLVDTPEMHRSWVVCIFQRILKHDNNTIVKWGVLNFVKLELEYSNNFSSILCLFIQTLNNSCLFSKTVNNVSEIQESLIVFLNNLMRYEAPCLIFQQIVKIVTSISWDPIALFHMVHALSSLGKAELLSRETLKVLKIFIGDSLGTHSVFIRGAIQCQLLKAIIQLSDTKLLDLATIAEFLGSFQRNESLKRGTHLWKSTMNWLNTFIDIEMASQYLISMFSTLQQDAKAGSIDLKSLSRILILLTDSVLHDHNSVKSSFHQLLFQSYDNIEKRLYSSGHTQDVLLEFIVYLLKDIEMNKKTENTPSTSSIIKSIENCTCNIFLYVKRRIASIEHVRDFHILHLYIDALEIFCNSSNLTLQFSQHIDVFQTMAIKMNETNDNNPMKQYSAMRILAWVSHCLKSKEFQLASVVKKQNGFIEKTIKSKNLNRILLKSKIDLEMTRDLQTLWGHLVSSYLQATWTILADYLVLNSMHVINVDEALIECLEIGGRCVLVEAMKVYEILLPSADDISISLNIIDRCWIATVELRKIELFWLAIKQFVNMIYQGGLFNKAWIQSHLKKYGRLIFEQAHSVSGLANILMARLQKEIISADQHELLSILLVDALLFGPLHRRDQKFEEEAIDFIKLLGEDCSVNELIKLDGRVDNNVRAVAVDLLLRIVNNNDKNHIISQLMKELIQRDEDVTSKKTRYFGDSQVHRIKHRVMQALLIIEISLQQKDAEFLSTWLCRSLLNENHQPSIRYQQEWLLARILVQYESLRANVWNVFSNAAIQRPGSMCSFIAVAHLVACSLVQEREKFIDTSMTMIFPWCMAQHFNVRIYAQVAMKKLWDMSKTHKYTDVTKKYELIISSLQISVDHGNAFKNAQKLQEDFYFNAFDPVRDFSLVTIYYELPRLANITTNEMISIEVFVACGVLGTASVPLTNKDSQLGSQAIAAWTLKSTGVQEDDNLSSNELQYNIQKKIIPWKAMLPDLSSNSETAKKKKQVEPGMIVVASLIDRPPNLGGLCRTCEVFGVSEYVLGNLKYVEDKQFQSLSVTAERWIPISEVKPHLLPQYLIAMKKVGYTLVGAEQTSNSLLLHETKFPKKTILLLGNEKEGVPANLLPLLDICVAVPQQGLVRSLNVHVTGAIFIWEYSRQHHL